MIKRPDAEPGTAPGRKAVSNRQRQIRRFVANRGAVLGLFVCSSLVVAGLLAPYLAPFDPIEVSLKESLQPPSHTHLMGTDLNGRDIYSRVLYGARLSLQLGVMAEGLAAVIGLTAGLIAGYYGRWSDTVLMRMMDVLLALPSFLLAMSAIAILGPSFGNAIVAIGLARIPGYARLVRGSVLTTKENQYVEVAGSMGARASRIMVRHILPNIMAPVIVFFTLGVGTAILFGSSLGFIGLGAQPPTPEWGRMLADGRDLMRRAWWVTVFPGLAIFVTVLGMNLFGDGLRSFMDPRLRAPGD